MTITYHWDVIQGTDEWRELRCGLITASQMKLLVTEKTLKAANNKDSRALVSELAAQRILKMDTDDFQSWDMLRGTKEEVLAKDLYSKNYKQVKDCGFITNETLGFAIGMSPDGLVGDDGGVEAKSRKAKLQVEVITADEIPSEDMAQVQAFFLVTGRKWLDYISYSNGMHMYVKGAEPIQEWQDALREAVIAAETQIVQKVQEYQEKTKDLVLAPWVDVMAEERGDIKPSDPVDVTMAG